jgi:hypothetical protein
VRSSLVLLALAGCDVVAGVDTEVRPCGDDMFDGDPVTITAADAFSLSWDRDVLVYVFQAFVYEQRLPDGEPQMIDLGIYPIDQVALAPEADALFYSPALEPPELVAALRIAPTQWTFDGAAPAGAYAGTPTSPEFGPRRVLVRPVLAGPIQEYVQEGNAWVAVGSALAIGGDHAPNLTASGLDMVFADPVGVHIAHRRSVDVAFGEPQLILGGEHARPQLLDRCHELYVIDPGEVINRYDR